MTESEFIDLKNLANVNAALTAVKEIIPDEQVVQVIDLRRITAQLIMWEIQLNKKIEA